MLQLVIVIAVALVTLVLRQILRCKHEDQHRERQTKPDGSPGAYLWRCARCHKIVSVWPDQVPRYRVTAPMDGGGMVPARFVGYQDIQGQRWAVWEVPADHRCTPAEIQRTERPWRPTVADDHLVAAQIYGRSKALKTGN